MGHLISLLFFWKDSFGIKTTYKSWYAVKQRNETNEKMMKNVLSWLRFIVSLDDILSMEVCVINPLRYSNFCNRLTNKSSSLSAVKRLSSYFFVYFFKLKNFFFDNEYFLSISLKKKKKNQKRYCLASNMSDNKYHFCNLWDFWKFVSIPIEAANELVTHELTNW